MDTSNERKRARNACLRCRKRKARCNAESQIPCTSCVSSGSRCLIVERKNCRRITPDSSSISLPIDSEILAETLPVEVPSTATATVNNSQFPTTPSSSENTWNVPDSWTNTFDEDVPSFPPSILGLDHRATAAPEPAATTVDHHQVMAWLMLCPIPLTGDMKKELAVHMSKGLGDSESEESLSLLLRCTDSIRTRVARAYSDLHTKNQSSIHSQCHCRSDGPGLADRILRESYEEKQTRQEDILARCQNLLELCVNAHDQTMSKENLDSVSSVPPSEAISITHHPRIASDMLFDKRIFDLSGSPLDKA